MDAVKRFVVRHFERLLVLGIALAAVLGNYCIDEKMVLLNFYYLPVLAAGYYLGKRASVLTAVLCVLAVVLLAVAEPAEFLGGRGWVFVFSFVAAWGGFLLLAGVVVGTLYERNQRRVEDLRRAYVGVLEILAKYLEDTDRYTKGHSLRVAEFSMDIAIAMQLSREEVENVRVGGLLHDIGKIEISGDLIRKAAALTDEERGVVDAHAERGAEILRQVGSVLKNAIPIVLASHQYVGEAASPERLPLGARIIAVADAFDALTSDRPYRKGMAPWKAYEELRGGAGRQFDAEVVEAFGRVLSAKKEVI